MASIIDRLLGRSHPPATSQHKKTDPEQQELARLTADANAVIAAFPPDSAPIRPLTRPEFDEMIEAYPYYKGRWRYTSIALAQAANLITDRGLRTALEMGAPVRPVIVGADVVDVMTRPELGADIQVTVHDARVVPWPFGDKAYDLFVALQVFEHLKGKQPEAFLEVRRIARHAIISLPIDWVVADTTNSHHQISNERVLSWFAPVVPTRVVQGSGGKHKRLIYVFEDLPSSD